METHRESPRLSLTKLKGFVDMIAQELTQSLEQGVEGMQYYMKGLG